MSFYTKRRGLHNQVKGTTTLFPQHTPIEENAINLSQKRSEPFINPRARQSVGYLQPRKIQQSHTRISPAQKICSTYPDGVTLINLNNREPGRSIPQCHPYLQSQNHHPRKKVCMQFYTNPRIDLHIPIDKLHFSPPCLHPQALQNVAAINNLKIDFTVDPNQPSDKQLKEEPIKKNVCINFQDICVLLDVLVTRIKWNFKHMLDSINTHAKISINDYWRDEGHLKFKLCLTDVINIIEEIKKLNVALLTQCQSPKELQADELTQELEAFIKRSRKMFVTEMQETLRNEYVQYCEDFFNNQLKVLFLEHKRKYREVFERILTENYRRNLKSIYREVEKTTKMVESATQTFTDAPSTKCTETEVIRKVTSQLKQIINVGDEKKSNGVKTNCEGVTIKNQSLQNMLNNHVTITQCPKSPSSVLKANTNIPKSHNLIQEAKVGKKMTDKREVTDTVIITPKYPIKADLPDGFRITRTDSSEGHYFAKDRVSYCDTDLILKRKKDVTVTDCTSKIKKRKFSCETSKHKRTQNGEKIIVIDSDREETCRNENDSDINSLKLKESEGGATKMTDQVKVRAEEFVKSRQAELEITPTIKNNTEANKTSRKSKIDSVDNKTTNFSKANIGELKRTDSNVSAIKTSASNMNKKCSLVQAIKKNELSIHVQTSSTPSQQKSLVRTSIINYINKNSLREKCTKPTVTVDKQFEETVHPGDQAITSEPINSKDCNLKSIKESQLHLKNVDGNENKSQAGMGFVQQIQGLEVKHHLTPEEYVDEVSAVDKMNIPIVFKRFYTYVTKQQILQQVNPISFKLFLELFNNGGLRNFYRKYMDYQKKHKVV